MLAASGLSLFQIISTLIGSGGILFLLNSIATDLNQPSITLDIVANKVNDSAFLKYPTNRQYNIDKSGGKGSDILNHALQTKP